MRWKAEVVYYTNIKDASSKSQMGNHNFNCGICSVHKFENTKTIHQRVKNHALIKETETPWHKGFLSPNPKA